MFDKRKLDSFMRDLVQKLEKRLAYYQDRFTVLSQEIGSIERTIDFDSYHTSENEERIKANYLRLKAKRENLVGCIFELAWILNLLKIGNSENLLNLYFGSYEDMLKMIHYGEEKESVEE